MVRTVITEQLLYANKTVVAVTAVQKGATYDFG
jgi:hypothetical protein